MRSKYADYEDIIIENRLKLRSYKEIVAILDDKGCDKPAVNGLMEYVKNHVPYVFRDKNVIEYLEDKDKPNQRGSIEDQIRCKGCYYHCMWSSTMVACYYNAITGHSRGCRGGMGCTCYRPIKNQSERDWNKKFNVGG